jgi:hypothetical protein
MLAAWYPLGVRLATAAYRLLARERAFLAIAGTSLAAWIGYSGLYTSAAVRPGAIRVY